MGKIKGPGVTACSMLNASSDAAERKYEISEEKLIITRRLMMLQWWG